ncbi:uncharacterized protein MELLADRAFT_68357 [Melampsora larici-populina 98AG31]|uniref:Uncharacterized protein n=1 Tax=Melampsora larici-populina (strain 98AG31 / pathotype 3-4-7) TaxID=747676 RepID=F4S6I1_MELLP|nr:uncharacterized protein MELLADRAFT_68357 [Melampsora larici-populina 98AG31]EGF99755.1 hypothetical protein MELLADRAFT_68357 [Melampsora larici-populina 98AG31]
MNEGYCITYRYHQAALEPCLFDFIIPLTVLEIFVLDIEDIKAESNRGQILLNIADLVQCTNIVTTKAVSEKDAEMFEFFYKRYHKTSRQVFVWCIDFESGLSAEMDRTMVRRFSQLQRLMGDQPIEENTNAEALAKSKSVRRKIELKDFEYDALLSYLKIKMPELCSHCDLPHPPKAKVLHRYAVPKPSWKISQYLLVSVLKPNNCIKYKHGGKSMYAMIKQIYVFTNPSGNEQTELLVHPIENLFPKDATSPSKDFRYLLHSLKCVIGRVEDHSVFVSPSNVVAVAAYRLLPNNTLSVAEGGVILRPYDYQSQLEDV